MFKLFLVAALALVSPQAVTGRLFDRYDSSSLLERTVTPDNTCGGSNGYTCNPNVSNGGPCCSSAGYCGNYVLCFMLPSGTDDNTGKTSAYCNSGCQWSFSNPGCNYTSANTCGGAAGYTCNPNSPNGGACCSTNGYCGSTAAYCGSGCQSAFGSCFGNSAPAYVRGTNAYEVPGVGIFTTAKNYTFTTAGSLNSDLAKSSYVVAAGTGDPYSHQFSTSLATVSGGFLQLTVPGGQKSSPIQCGEVSTVQKKILYASVRTYAQFSSVAGTCHGQFFYYSDTQEIDTEYLTDPNSQSNPGDGTKPLQYTNQATDGNRADETHANVPSPSNAASAVHEYRTDWVAGKVTFYLDGVLQKTFTTNVPTTPGPWVWNNWSSGNKGFTAGPPASDNTFLIKNIVMYYNVSSS